MTHIPRELATKALAGLLNEFRHGNIVARSAEQKGMEQHTGALSAQWNDRFPGFPVEDFPYASLRGVFHRNRRDAHLKNIIVQLLADRGRETTIVNPACVFGRHACHLATRLPDAKVIAADIYPRCFQLYRVIRLGVLPGNFTFAQENIFAPQLNVEPTAVVFFGACGSVSDGSLDYAIASGASHVMCRTCCHELIGGNVTVSPRPNPVNRLFRIKNWVFERIKKAPQFTDHYFSARFTPNAYPRSAAGRQLSAPDEFMAVARNSTDSDMCRAIIDLDRYLRLAEQGFQVHFQGDLLVAERASAAP